MTSWLPHQTLHVPAFTAYTDPDPHALSVSDEGISGWTNPAIKVLWFGHFPSRGRLDVALCLKLPEKALSRFRLTVVDTQLTAEARGIRGGGAISVPFGSVEIPGPGYQEFCLEGSSHQGPSFGAIEALILSGPASQSAHFNLDKRRNAPSVHLGYPVSPTNKVEWFYNEVTVREDPIWSYYMVCGFDRGYFGIQVKNPTERWIIFSVWDSGSEAVDRSKVPLEHRAKCLEKGEGVVVEPFPNEGTGERSHLVYAWKTGETQRFIVSARPEGSSTVYTAWFWFPERNGWGLIASLLAPKDGKHLRGLYSFNEDFANDGANGHLRRQAEFGNGWIRTPDADGKQWSELLTASFTHDDTGKKNRKDYGAGVTQNGRFYLSNGGFVAEPVSCGQEFHLPPGMGHPPDPLPVTATP